MTYQEFIENILTTRGRFACGEEYHERHHIQPKCMGGSNEEENLIDLYPQEHYEAHKLLFEENPHNSGLALAWWNMCHVRNGIGDAGRDIIEITKDEYTSLRNQYLKTCSGENHPLFGKHILEEARKKMSEARKGKPVSQKAIEGTKRRWANLSEEEKRIYKENLSIKFSGKNNPMYGVRLCGEANANYGKQLTEEHKKKIREKRLGTKMSKEAKQKMSKAHRGRKPPWSDERRNNFLRTVKTMFPVSPVRCVETNTVYPSMREASRQTGVRQSCISNCCRGKQERAGKLHWEFIKEVV